MKTNKLILIPGLLIILAAMSYLFYTKLYLPNIPDKREKEPEIQMQSIQAQSKTDAVLDLVYEEELVKNQIELIDSLSGGKRNITLIPILSDTAKNIYTVKVLEDVGEYSVTYYTFLVDANSMEIINKNGKIEGQ